MNASTPPSPHVAAPGTERPRRFRPKLRYELIGCGLHGHEILGTDAAALRPEDELFAIRSDGGVIRTTAGEVRRTGRQTMGVRLINLPEGQSVVAVARNAEPDADSETGES